MRGVSAVLTLALVSMAGLGGLGVLLYHQFERPGPLEVTRTIAIPKGEGRIEIAERLEREGVIANRWTFVASHLLQGWLGNKKAIELKAGEYEIKKNASMRQVLETIAEGKSILYKVTIPEGLTSQQIIERLAGEANLSGDVAEVPAEGSLLPDTYRFSKGISRQELIERMQAEQQRFVASLWERRRPDLPLENVRQALILASIVEKETGRSDERDRVAAVFVNRLRKGMRLQSDPTIIYGLVAGQGSLGRPIARSDIDQRTDYNTYQIDGLPPTPICNPGRSAIEATLNHAKVNDLFFVADGSGGHKFSETLREHNAAVATWRKVEREIRAKQEAEKKGDLATKAPGAEDEAGIPAPPASAQPAGAATGEAKPAPTTASAIGVPLPVRKPKK